MTGTVVNSCEVPVNIESTPEQPGISLHHVGYIYTSEVYRRGVLSLWQVYKHTICFASGTPPPPPPLSTKRTPVLRLHIKL